MAKQSNDKTSSAKKQKTGPSPRGGKDTRKGGGSAGRTPTVSQAKKPVYEWMPFTKKSVDFNTAAKGLAVYLETTYGQGVSITQYEKFLMHLPTATQDERTRLYVDEEGIQLAQAYETAKDARDAERNSFRSDIAVADVQGTLASLLTTIQGLSGPKRGNADMEAEEEPKE